MRSATLLAVAALLLAGCAGKAGPASTDTVAPSTSSVVAGPAEFTETLGALSGTVTDSETIPLEGVEVAISGLGATTVTDVAGQFSFSHVEPGTYEVFAARLGYQSGASRVTIVAGEESHTSFFLTVLATEEAYHEIFQQRGLLGCAVQVDPVNGLSACGAAAIVTLLTGQNTSNIDRFALFWKNIQATGPLNTTLLDMTWQSTQALGSGLQVIWEVNTCSGDPDLQFGATVGRSPLHLRVDRERIEAIVAASSKPDNCQAQGIVTFDTSEVCNAEKCEMQTRVFSAAETTGQAADVGLALQQPFEQFISNFYFAPAPEAYSALADG